MTADDRAQERLDQARKARRERIVSDKADAFDCTSENDIVCPHCGAWSTEADSDLKLSKVVRGDSIWHKLHCNACLRLFHLRVEVRYSFTTMRPDPDL